MESMLDKLLCILLYIIPRYRGDELTLSRRTREDYVYGEREAKELIKAIRQSMQ